MMMSRCINSAKGAGYIPDSVILALFSGFGTEVPKFFQCLCGTAWLFVPDSERKNGCDA